MRALTIWETAIIAVAIDRILKRIFKKYQDQEESILLLPDGEKVMLIDADYKEV